ncbi:MAG: hypothetical protein JXO44_02070 [Clostridia bacterium]|nr:hypothetical protein [Clostridia bacterium]
MSAFLAPIHFWLYNKIKLMEDIEKKIIQTVDLENIQALSEETQKEIAPFLPEASLEAIIDQGNIHGWLQNKITSVERRQALLIKKIESTGYPGIYDLTESIYENFGHDAAQNAAIQNSNDLNDIFNKLNNYLLEGMPCDRVNKVVNNSESELSWEITRCVHTDNWSTVGVPVERYYAFRAAFIKGFVTSANPSLSYRYTNDDQQLSVIAKEK